MLSSRDELNRPFPGKRIYGWLAFGSLLVTLCGSTPSALYPLYQKNFIFPSWMLTVVFAVFISGIIAALLVIQVLDRINQRHILVIASAISIVGATMFLASNSLTWLLGASFVQGIGVGLYQSTVNAVLVKMVSEEQYPRATLASSRMGTIGLAAGPLIAGLLAEYAPAPLRLIYLIELLFLLPLLAVILLTSSESNYRRSDHVTENGEQYSGWRTVPIILLFITVFLSFASGAFLNAIGSTILVTWLDVNSLAVGGMAVTLLFGSSAITQSWVTKHNPVIVMCIGLIFAAAGLFANAIAVGMASSVLVLASVIVVGSGQGCAYAGSLALLNITVPGKRLAAMTSRYYLAAYVGAAVPSLAGGWAIAQFGATPAVLLFACWISVPAVALILLVSKTSNRASPPHAG